MIIIEGTDLVGKTTLADKIVELNNMGKHVVPLEYKHLGPLPDDWTVTDYMRLLSSTAVYDRFFVSELVYHPLNLKPCKLSKFDTLNITRALLWHYKTTNVLVLGDENKIAERYADLTTNHGRKELFTVEQVILAQQRFKCIDTESTIHNNTMWMPRYVIPTWNVIINFDRGTDFDKSVHDAAVAILNFRGELYG